MHTETALSHLRDPRAVAAALLVSSLLAGCSVLTDRREEAFALATHARFSPAQVNTAGFDIVVFHRGLSGARRLSVYIEGDGRVARTPTRLSRDPTPGEPVGLELAAADTSPAVLYVSRPCQYLTEEALSACHPRYWSFSRYSETVVAAIGKVLDWAVDTSGNPGLRIGLTGFSGGGTLAALVAARRGDIDWLVTVAANLDHRKWTDLHHLTPLADSLNPVDYAPALEPLPQLHFVGGDDENVPRAVAESYLAAFEDISNIAVETVDGYTHHCCWAEHWETPSCTLFAHAGVRCSGD